MRTYEGILDGILKDKRWRIKNARATVPFEWIYEAAYAAPSPLSLTDAIRSYKGLAIMAEMKRASPSGGILNIDLQPAETARMFSLAGATALSVLTEASQFMGTLNDLKDAKNASLPHNVPILQKDFIIDDYQICEGRVVGADAVLLMISVLPPQRYTALSRMAKDLGMTPLTEVHDEHELEVAMRENPDILGINNRDLLSLTTTLDTFERLAKRVPPNVLIVAESGIKNSSDARRMANAGADAILIGEALMRAGSEAPSLINSLRLV